MRSAKTWRGPKRFSTATFGGPEWGPDPKMGSERMGSERSPKPSRTPLEQGSGKHRSDVRFSNAASYVFGELLGVAERLCCALSIIEILRRRRFLGNTQKRLRKRPKKRQKKKKKKKSDESRGRTVYLCFVSQGY